MGFYIGPSRLALLLIAGHLLLSASLAAEDADSSVCAVGDLHGDLSHALKALALCGAVDEHSGKWIGGTRTIVQTGDVLDRGNESLPLLRHLWLLRDEAKLAGGELVLLMGNHELLNMQGAAHYVDAGELARNGGAHAWRQLLSPTHGEIGTELVAQHKGVAVRGGGACRTLFLHAGLRLGLGSKYGSIEAINTALHDQVTTNRGPLLDAHDGPLWWRGYARPAYSGMTEDESCAELRAVLASLGEGARRMAVGHNIVPFVATRCAGALVNIDVGMSSAYGGRPAAWRCDVDAATGEATTRALYVGGSEVPPDLCEACAEVHAAVAALDAFALRGHDEHGDCRNYCSGQSGRSQLLRRRAQQLQKGKQQQGANTVESTAAAPSTSLFGSWLQGGGGGEGASASNHVKTEF